MYIVTGCGPFESITFRYVHVILFCTITPYRRQLKILLHYINMLHSLIFNLKHIDAYLTRFCYCYVQTPSTNLSFSLSMLYFDRSGQTGQNHMTWDLPELNSDHRQMHLNLSRMVALKHFIVFCVNATQRVVKVTEGFLRELALVLCCLYWHHTSVNNYLKWSSAQKHPPSLTLLVTLNSVCIVVLRDHLWQYKSRFATSHLGLFVTFLCM